MEEKRDTKKALIFKIILFVVAISVFLCCCFGVPEKIKDATYRPKKYEAYGLKFQNWQYDTINGSKKKLLYSYKLDLYPVYEYKNEATKNEYFDFEIIDNEATITKVKKMLPGADIYIPKTVKINSKKYKVTSLSSGCLDEFEYLKSYDGRFSCSIYGNDNIKSLNDNFISKAYIKLYNFPNLKYIGSGDYFINYLVMNNNLESVHFYNLFCDRPSNYFYIGDKCKIIDLSNEEIDWMNNYKTSGKYYEASRFFKKEWFDLSKNNPYYIEKDNVLYSRDMKKIYLIEAADDFKINIYENDVEIMPLAFSCLSLTINFYGSVNEIHSYAINSWWMTLNFYNDVNNIDEHIFSNFASSVTMNFNGHAKNYNENSFAMSIPVLDKKIESYITINLS